MTNIEIIRAIAEELLNDKHPREQRLDKITAALNASYKMGGNQERERIIQSLQKQPEVLSMPEIVPVIRRIIESV